jgi:hypothetical protein
VLPDAERYRVAGVRFDQDVETGRGRVDLRVRHEETGEIVWLRFENGRFRGLPFPALPDAQGLYVMDATYQDRRADERIQVGDFKDGTPIFWAESVEVVGG